MADAGTTYLGVGHLLLGLFRHKRSFRIASTRDECGRHGTSKKLSLGLFLHAQVNNCGPISQAVSCCGHPRPHMRLSRIFTWHNCSSCTMARTFTVVMRKNGKGPPPTPPLIFPPPPLLPPYTPILSSLGFAASLPWQNLLPDPPTP